MKKILVINDISGLGNCSEAVNLPILSVMGHTCIPLATAMFSAQTGFDGFMFTENSHIEEYACHILSFDDVDCIYTGFCLGSSQLKAVTKVIRLVQAKGGFVVADPVMGDDGRLYPVYGSDYVDAMRQAVSGVDCITPNLTEACLLCDVDYDALSKNKYGRAYLPACAKALEDICTVLSVKTAVVSGVDLGNLVGNIVFENGEIKYVTNEKHWVNYSGTGDIFSSVVTGALMNGNGLLQATEKAVSFISAALNVTANRDRRKGIDFQKVLPMLIES